MRLDKSISLSLGTALLSLSAAQAMAETKLPPVTVGAGVQASFKHREVNGVATEADDFNLDSARIYIGGKATENISIMFNTEYTGGDEKIQVIDAVAQFSFGDAFNIWAGRFLPPSDRANLYGPYYSNEYGVYTDSIQDGYPFETTGRDDGLMYWGQYGIAKVSLGVFDVQGLTKGTSDVLTAARVQLDFWDQEAGYYLNGTYYGDKDLLAIGVAGQNSHGNNAYSVDFLLEKKLPAGVISIESEYAKYDGLGGYPSPRFTSAAQTVGVPYKSSDGYYLLAAYLFPMDVGIGKFQVLAKYAKAKFDYTAGADVDQKTTELNFNYIIRQFNARVSAFYIDTDFSPTATTIQRDSKTYGVALQVQM